MWPDLSSGPASCLVQSRPKNRILGLKLCRRRKLWKICVKWKRKKEACFHCGGAQGYKILFKKVVDNQTSIQLLGPKTESLTKFGLNLSCRRKYWEWKKGRRKLASVVAAHSGQGYNFLCCSLFIFFSSKLKTNSDFLHFLAKHRSKWTFSFCLDTLCTEFDVRRA